MHKDVKERKKQYKFNAIDSDAIKTLTNQSNAIRNQMTAPAAVGKAKGSAATNTPSTPVMKRPHPQSAAVIFVIGGVVC